MQVTIDIDRQGGTVIKVDGVKGASCKDVTKALERSLGTVTQSKKTPEYYEQAENQNGLSLGTGA